MVEADDSIMDGAVESVEIGEGVVGEIMLLVITPASFDVVQLGGVFRQPFEGEPRARGERLGCQLAAVDRPVVEHRDQGSGAFGGAVCGPELVEQGEEVGGALVRRRQARFCRQERIAAVSESFTLRLSCEAAPHQHLL